jgi:hypothetical protein
MLLTRRTFLSLVAALSLVPLPAEAKPKKHPFTLYRDTYSNSY